MSDETGQAWRRVDAPPIGTPRGTTWTPRLFETDFNGGKLVLCAALVETDAAGRDLGFTVTGSVCFVPPEGKAS